MTQRIPVSATPPPIVCTLSAAELAERGLEWSDLGPLALTSERIDGGIASTYPLEIADQVEDLANRESSCCGTWLSAAVSRVDGVVRLELTTANPDGLAIIVSMAGLDS